MSATPKGNPPILVTRPEAAALLGCSVDFFEQHVEPHIRAVRLGRRFLRFPVEELQKWARQNAAVK